MTKGVKHPSPFKIKMGFDEALERFIGTKPNEVDALVKRGKRKSRRAPRKNARRPTGPLNPSWTYATDGCENGMRVDDLRCGQRRQCPRTCTIFPVHAMR